MELLMPLVPIVRGILFFVGVCICTTHFSIGKMHLFREQRFSQTHLVSQTIKLLMYVAHNQ